MMNNMQNYILKIKSIISTYNSNLESEKLYMTVI